MNKTKIKSFCIALSIIALVALFFGVQTAKAQADGYTRKISVPVQVRSEPDIHLTESEIDLMARVVMAEIGKYTEPQEARIAVANVILNRLNYGYWGHTVKSVVYSKHQFAKPKKTATRDCYDAVYAALGGVEVVGPDVMFFREASSWKRGTRVAKIGTLYFYVYKGNLER